MCDCIGCSTTRVRVCVDLVTGPDSVMFPVSHSVRRFKSGTDRDKVFVLNPGLSLPFWLIRTAPGQSLRPQTIYICLRFRLSGCSDTFMNRRKNVFDGYCFSTSAEQESSHMMNHWTTPAIFSPSPAWHWVYFSLGKWEHFQIASR